MAWAACAACAWCSATTAWPAVSWALVITALREWNHQITAAAQATMITRLSRPKRALSNIAGQAAGVADTAGVAAPDAGVGAGVRASEPMLIMMLTLASAMS